MIWVRHARNFGLTMGLILTMLPAFSNESLVPGVVVDSDRLFMMNPNGQIDAIAIESGSVLWTSNAAAMPLTVLNGLLVSQAEATKAGVLDAVVLEKNSGNVNKRLSISVPNKVWALVSDQLGRQFLARGGVRDDQIYLVWEQTIKPVRGAWRPESASAPEILTAAHRLDLPGNTSQSADTSILDRRIPTLPQEMNQLFQQGQLSGEPFYSGNTFAAVTSPNQGGQNQVRLLRWQTSTGERLADIVLTSGATILQLPSADQQHLLVSKRANRGAWEEYSWSIFHIDTGAKLGEISSHFSHAQFLVKDSILLHDIPAHGRQQETGWADIPRQLRAVQLVGGTEIWTRPLRDLSYRGQMPP